MGHAGLGCRAGLSAHAPRSSATTTAIRCSPRAATLVALGALTAAARCSTTTKPSRQQVMAEAGRLVGAPRLATAEEVMAPLTARRPDAVAATRAVPASDRRGQRMAPRPDHARRIHQRDPRRHPGRPGRRHWSSARTSAVKGGVYGVTRGLRKRFGGLRVFDTVLDEQTILGTALGAVAGRACCRSRRSSTWPTSTTPRTSSAVRPRHLPSSRTASTATAWWCESRDSATRRASAATSTTTTRSRCSATSRVWSSPSRPTPRRRRRCCGPASPSRSRRAGSACSSSRSRSTTSATCSTGTAAGWRRTGRPHRADPDAFGRVTVHGTGEDLLLVTFGNGVRLSMRAAARLAAGGHRLRRPGPPVAGAVAVRRPGCAMRDASARSSWWTRRASSGGVAEGCWRGLADARLRRHGATRREPGQLRAARAGGSARAASPRTTSCGQATTLAGLRS